MLAAAPPVLGAGRGSVESAWQGWASWGSGVHTRGTGGSSWRRRSPNEEEARGRPALCAGCGGAEPWQPGDLEGEPHLRSLTCTVPWVALYRSSRDWSQSRLLHPSAWPSIPGKGAPLRRIPGPSFDHRKWRLGGGRRLESWQESRGPLLGSRVAAALQSRKAGCRPR